MSSRRSESRSRRQRLLDLGAHILLIAGGWLRRERLPLLQRFSALNVVCEPLGRGDGDGRRHLGACGLCPLLSLDLKLCGLRQFVRRALDEVLLGWVVHETLRAFEVPLDDLRLGGVDNLTLHAMPLRLRIDRRNLARVLYRLHLGGLVRPNLGRLRRLELAPRPGRSSRQPTRYLGHAASPSLKGGGERRQCDRVSRHRVVGRRRQLRRRRRRKRAAREKRPGLGVLGWREVGFGRRRAHPREAAPLRRAGAKRKARHALCAHHRSLEQQLIRRRRWQQLGRRERELWRRSLPWRRS